MRRRIRPNLLRRRGQSGFTLIEMLVGLVLLALAVGLLPSGLKLGLQAWASRGDLDRVDSLAMMVGALEQRISQAIPIFERDKRGGIRVLFEGDSTTLRFIGPAETGPSGAGVFRTRFAPHSLSATEIEGTGLAIELSIYTTPTTGPPPQPTTHIVASSDVTIRFRYFGETKAGTTPQWHAAWQRPDQMPMLVEVTGEIRTSKVRHLHRQIIVPRIGIRS